MARAGRAGLLLIALAVAGAACERSPRPTCGLDPADGKSAGSPGWIAKHAILPHPLISHETAQHGFTSRVESFAGEVEGGRHRR